MSAPYERILESAPERLRVAALGSIAFGAISWVYGVFVHPGEIPWSIYAGIAVALIYCGAVYVAVTAGRVSRELTSPLSAAMAVLATILTAWAYSHTRTIDYAVMMAAVMVNGGLLFVYRRWLVVTLVAVPATWFPIGFAVAGRDFGAVAIGLACVGVIALMVNVVSTAYLTRLDQLRVQERDALAERHRLQAQLQHGQKLESLGTLAGGVAHDMNNVLAAIVGLAELVRDQVTGQAREDIDHLIQSAERGAELTRNLLAFSRRGNYQRTAVAIPAMIASVVVLLERTLAKRVAIRTELSAACVVEGDPGRLGQMVVNLCLNAVDAMNGQGELAIRHGERAVDAAASARLGVAPGRYATVEIVDHGCGMDAATRDRMFEPFFTTKQPGVGTGLGLAMVYGTVKAHAGAIEVDTELGRGTTITILLPASAQPATQPTVAAAPPRGKGKVLVVDDEPAMRAVAQRCLERAGYTVETAADGAAGCERYTARGGFDLVLLDMAMPVMNGPACFRELRARDPNARVLIVSGFAHDHEAQRCQDAGALGFIAKPYRQAELVARVAAALEPPRPAGERRRPSSLPPAAPRPIIGA